MCVCGRVKIKFRLTIIIIEREGEKLVPEGMHYCLQSHRVW